MADQSPLEYYAKRALQEASRAENATDPAVRRAHQEMAERYDEIVATGVLPEPRLRLRLRSPGRDA